MKDKNHVHKLKRHKFKTGSAVFFCVGDNCYFKIAISLSLGKESICWRCGKPFKLDEYAIRLSKPHCKDCHHPKEAEAQPDELRSRMNEIFKRLDEAPSVADDEI